MSKNKNEILVYRMVDGFLRYWLRVLPVLNWTERLALWWGFRFRPAPCNTKLRSGASIFVRPTDYLQLLIYYQGTFEPHCLPYLRRCAGPGDTIVDVGANIGFYTLESAQAVGATGRVISIEAAPPHVATLRKNVQLNAMDNVTLIESAVSDALGEATLALPKGDNLGMFTLGQVDGDETYRVSLRTLDDLIAEQRVDSVALIKMDIEGSEYRALRGAARTLAAYKPVLLVELNELALSRCGSSTRQVKDLLQDAGYRGWVIGRGGLRAVPNGNSRQECDECLFIHRDSEILMRNLGLLYAQSE